MTLWTGQALHALLLGLLLGAVLVAMRAAGPLDGAWAGLSADVWLWAAIAAPIVHQVFVWLCWRTELRNRAVSRTLGFRPYVVVFMLLFWSRFVTAIALAWANRGSLEVPFVGWAAALIATSLPAAYAGYSVIRYFGIPRATGADHFQQRYRTMPLVNQGIFRYTNNGMYMYAFLGFWAIAIGFASVGALIAAAFAHAYIWVHFLCTERPDMRAIYTSATMAE